MKRIVTTPAKFGAEPGAAAELVMLSLASTSLRMAQKWILDAGENRVGLAQRFVAFAMGAALTYEILGGTPHRGRKKASARCGSSDTHEGKAVSEIIHLVGESPPMEIRDALEFLRRKDLNDSLRRIRNKVTFHWDRDMAEEFVRWRAHRTQESVVLSAHEDDTEGAVVFPVALEILAYAFSGEGISGVEELGKKVQLLREVQSNLGRVLNHLIIKRREKIGCWLVE